MWSTRGGSTANQLTGMMFITMLHYLLMFSFTGIKGTAKLCEREECDSAFPNIHGITLLQNLIP